MFNGLKNRHTVFLSGRTVPHSSQQCTGTRFSTPSPTLICLFVNGHRHGCEVVSRRDFGWDSFWPMLVPLLGFRLPMLIMWGPEYETKPYTPFWWKFFAQFVYCDKLLNWREWLGAWRFFCTGWLTGNSMRVRMMLETQSLLFFMSLRSLSCRPSAFPWNLRLTLFSFLYAIIEYI